MSITNTDSTTQLAFSMSDNPGVYAVLLGSGVSRSAGIPTGWEITLELIRRAGIAAGAGEQDDWHRWYVEQRDQQPNYSTLLEELASTPKERQAIIESFLKPSEDEREQGLKLPTPAHRAIADLVKTGHVRVIITTNFDRLMENALRDVGIEPTVVSSADGFAGAEPLTHTNCYILKLHGDFKDAGILNTDSELSEYPLVFDGLLDRILMSSA
jgi:NAD-dependent SIR2 family protein deacetylase